MSGRRSSDRQKELPPIDYSGGSGKTSKSANPDDDTPSKKPKKRESITSVTAEGGTPTKPFQKPPGSHTRPRTSSKATNNLDAPSKQVIKSRNGKKSQLLTNSTPPPELENLWLVNKIMTPPLPSLANPELRFESVVRYIQINEQGQRQIHYQHKGHRKGQKNLPNGFYWIASTITTPDEFQDWATAEQKRAAPFIEKLKEKPGKGQRLPQEILDRMNLIRDIAEGESIPAVRPDGQESPSPPAVFRVQDRTATQTSTPRFSLPELVKGTCGDALILPHLVHNNNIAPCQSSNHDADDSDYNICSDCHYKALVSRLNDQEIKHIIRDNGFYPLCNTCAQDQSNVHGITAQQNFKNCVCEKELPVWMCLDCWIAMARARRYERDCDECSCGAKGEVGGTVHR
ncbi:hypothetical protein E4T38_07737 [Aureobasidium subglaciale]|nr:hypothetical protein E4T38_07737 [Aureobasidium subglaciale]KAI5216786.1 hypothetical protein E4T40_07747 [Aureobasidium subglaciale]KAI5220000.1 hypothetical protein E4T41_07662 [Aureobasidium subglaciale]KAI5257883.1 hypothetical protein E4T46_07638 [Aureobasidium subglaciale]